MTARITLIILAGLWIGARASGAEAPSFEKDVLPILNAHCLQCHGGIHQKSGLDLRSVGAMLRGGKQGKAVVPGDPDNSLLLTMIADDTMPPKAIKVSAEQKKVLRAWVAAGAKSVGRRGPVSVPAKARTAEELAALIDREIDAALAAAKVPASPLADDGEFLRRVFLDVHGRIPTRARAAAFLDDRDAKKRQRLIEELLADPAYGHYWARQWRDRVAVPVGAGEDLSGSQGETFRGWLAAEFNKNSPWDGLVRAMLTAEGDAPPVAFVRQCMDDGQPRAAKLAASAARRFLGVQLQCAECHDHPFAAWKQEDFWGLAAFFSRTAKLDKTRTSNKVGIFDTEAGPPKTRFGLKPLERREGGAVVLPEDAGPRAGKVVVAKFLEGGPVTLDPKAPARPLLADWITSPKNPYFARATVNRLWAQLYGRGLIDPPDSLDSENVASHPAILDELAGGLVASGHDLKLLLRGMLLSKAYQRTHRTVAGNEKDATLRSHATVKVIPPESLFDCLVIASGGDPAKPNTGLASTGKNKGGTFASRREFLALFGTAGIDDDPTDYTQGIPQLLSLLNAPAMQGAKLVEQAVKEAGGEAAIVERLYLAVLSRRPTDDERQVVGDFLGKQKTPAAGCQAVWWALVNTPEFAMIP